MSLPVLLINYCWSFSKPRSAGPAWFQQSRVTIHWFLVHSQDRACTGLKVPISALCTGEEGNRAGSIRDPAREEWKSNIPRATKDERKWQNGFGKRLGKGAPETQENRQPSQRRRKIKGWVRRKQEIMSWSKEASTVLGCSPALLIEGRRRAHQLVTTPIFAEAGATSPCRGPTHTLASQRAPRKQHVLAHACLFWLPTLLTSILALGSSEIKPVLESHMLMPRWAAPAVLCHASQDRTTCPGLLLALAGDLVRTYRNSSISDGHWRIQKKRQWLNKTIASFTWMKEMAFAIVIHLTFQLCFSYFTMSLPNPCTLHFCKGNTVLSSDSQSSWTFLKLS